MTLALLILSVLSIVAVVSTVACVARDGYRQIPTRDPRAHPSIDR